MGALRRRGLNRTLLRVALALVAGYLLAPAPARASCGDYVHVGSDRPRPNHTESPAPPPPQPTPCHGPSCSGAPASAPPATVPVAPPRPQEWAALVCLTPPPEPAFGATLAECPRGLAVRPDNSVFHPPRTSPASALG